MKRKTRERDLGRVWLVALVLAAVAAGLGLGLAIQQRPSPAAAPGRPTPVATLPLQYQPAASPEAQPVLTLVIVVTDATTGQPVLAEIWAGGSRVAEQSQALDVSLRVVTPGEKWVRLRIEAAGYETWERDMSFKVNYTRRVDLPVQLQPLRSPTGPGGA